MLEIDWPSGGINLNAIEILPSIHHAQLPIHLIMQTTPLTGRRVFKVMCNGQTLLDKFDIFREAGSLHELTKTFHHLSGIL